MEKALAPSPALALALIVAGIVNRVGTDVQRERIIPALVSGRSFACLGYSEPDAGSDLASITTRAVRDGDHWVINGAKMWTTLAHEADWVLLLTRTDPDVPKHKGLTTFILPLDTPGITVKPVHTMSTERTNATFYDDVRVSDEWRLGAENGGWGVLTVGLAFERGVVGDTSHGVPLLRQFREWAEATGAIAEPLVRERMARAAIDNEVAKLLAQRSAWIAASGGLPGVEGSVTKLFAAPAFQKAAHWFQQAAGPAGLRAFHEAGAAADGWIDHASRSAPVLTIRGGTTEINRNNVAERGLGFPKARWSSRRGVVTRSGEPPPSSAWQDLVGSDPLDDRGSGHAATRAHRHERRLAIGALEFVEGGEQEHAAAGADGVTERDGPAVDVHVLRIEIELPHGLQHHRGERLVDLPQVDVTDRHPGFVEATPRCRRGRGQHDHRVVAGDGGHPDARTRPHPVGPSPLGGGHEQSGGAVDDARAVARMVDVGDRLDVGVHAATHVVIQLAVRRSRRAQRFECRGERGECLERGSGPNVFVTRERHRSVGRDDWHKASREPFLPDRGGSALLAEDGDLIANLPAEPLTRRDQVGGDALRNDRVSLAEARVVAVERGASSVRPSGHRFDASTDDDVLHAGHHAHGGQRDCLLSAAAVAVHGEPRRLPRPTGGENAETADARTMIAGIAAVSDDDVVDRAWVDARARRQRLQALREQLLRMEHVERPRLLPLASRGPHTVDDPRLTHVEIVTVSSEG